MSGFVEVDDTSVTTLVDEATMDAEEEGVEVRECDEETDFKEEDLFTAINDVLLLVLAEGLVVDEVVVALD